MDEDQGVSTPLRQEVCGQHRLPQTRWCYEYTHVMPQESFGSALLNRTELAMEPQAQSRAGVTLILYDQRDAAISEHVLDLLMAAAGQPK